MLSSRANSPHESSLKQKELIPNVPHESSRLLHPSYSNHSMGLTYLHTLTPFQPPVPLVVSGHSRSSSPMKCLGSIGHSFFDLSFPPRHVQLVDRATLLHQGDHFRRGGQRQEGDAGHLAWKRPAGPQCSGLCFGCGGICRACHCKGSCFLVIFCVVIFNDTQQFTKQKKYDMHWEHSPQQKLSPFSFSDHFVGFNHSNRIHARLAKFHVLKSNFCWATLW